MQACWKAHHVLLTLVPPTRPSCVCQTSMCQASRAHSPRTIVKFILSLVLPPRPCTAAPTAANKTFVWYVLSLWGRVFSAYPNGAPRAFTHLERLGPTSSLLAAFKTMAWTASRFSCFQRLSSPRLAARPARAEQPPTRAWLHGLLSYDRTLHDLVWGCSR